VDSLINAASRALSKGDPLVALKLVALRNDAPGLALRGIAMAQLGELRRARELLRAAALAFGPGEPLFRARCVVAEAEVALALRDLGWPPRRLEAARVMLQRHGDAANAAHARYVAVRRLLLIGHLEEAQQALGSMSAAPSPALRLTHELIVAHIAMRRLQSKAAHDALVRAGRLALQAGIPALTAEVGAALAQWKAPAARLLTREGERFLRLQDVEALLASDALIIDGIRHAARRGRVVVGLARRPVLMSLLRTLAISWPSGATREQLVAQAFRMRRVDESLRARLRVEIGRLRRALRALARIEATPRGFCLAPAGARHVHMLATPMDEPHADVLALLAEGEAWSTSALALALGVGQRTVQRGLEALARDGKVRSVGRGRARRWSSGALPGITTLLLLPSGLPTN